MRKGNHFLVGMTWTLLLIKLRVLRLVISLSKLITAFENYRIYSYINSVWFGKEEKICTIEMLTNFFALDVQTKQK